MKQKTSNIAGKKPRFLFVFALLFKLFLEVSENDKAEKKTEK